jgi:hypothetical protein
VSSLVEPEFTRIPTKWLPLSSFPYGKAKPMPFFWDASNTARPRCLQGLGVKTVVTGELNVFHDLPSTSATNFLPGLARFEKPCSSKEKPYGIGG